jgi:hypothetical protein
MTWSQLKDQLKGAPDLPKIDGVVYDPVLSPNEDISKVFKTRSDTDIVPDYELMGIKGKSSSGKTRLALSLSKCCAGLIEKEVTKDEAKVLIDLLGSGLLPDVTPIWVLGTEESTQKELYAIESKDYYSNTDIKYVEVCEFTDGKIDHLKTFNNFMKFMKRFAVNTPKGTIVIDGFSSILYCMHEIIRRDIMSIPEFKKEQGVPAKYWFWRNTNCEIIMLMLRRIPMHKILTYKITKGRETEDEIEWKTRWHEDTNKHLSDTIIENSLIEKNNTANFISKFEKCRNKKSLIHKEFSNLNGTKLLYEVFSRK